jgi:hypothetical protein
MNEIVKPQVTSLSTDMLAKLRRGIAESRASTALVGIGGKPLLRMLKSGSWVYGPSDEEVQEGSWWAINPLSILHGWVAWTNHTGATKNTMVGELLAPVFEPKPMRPQPVDGWPFNEQRVFELRCMNGDDVGVEVIHKSSSIGGMRAIDDLLKTQDAQLDADPAHPCLVVELLSGSYKHQKYGQIYTPEFKVVGFASMTGELAGQEQIEAPAAEAAPARRRAAAAPAGAPEAPAPTQAVHTPGSPRRRPAAR